MKENKDLFFSVVIANFNRGLKCLRAVNSVLNQSYPCFECIVLDDASTDSSIQILNSINDPRFKLVKHEQNIGQSMMFNKNIPSCSYDWIAFLDSDDYWHKDRLLNQVPQIKKFGNKYGLYYCSSEIIYNNSNRRNVPAIYDGNHYENMKFRNYVGVTSRVIVNKKIYIKVGGFDPNLPTCKDWDCWLRISKETNIKSLNEVLVYYEEASDSVSFNLDKIKQGRYMFWKKTFGCKLNDIVEADLRLEFSKFLLSRGFQKEAILQSRKAFELNKSVKSALFFLATLFPPFLVRKIYSFSKFRLD